MERETFGSRLGFILISAGCAIGLGNVWRFPYIVGEYGGAAFILIYLLFLVLLGIPIMTMEFSVGRASRKSVASSFRDLEPKGTKWHIFGYFGMAGNYLLMMFYTTVSGWMLAYLVKMAKGDFVNLSGDAIKQEFDNLTADPWMMLLFMGIIVLVGFGICSLGLKKRCGADYQGYDDPSNRHHDCSCGAFHHPAKCRRRSFLLFGPRF